MIDYRYLPKTDRIEIVVVDSLSSFGVFIMVDKVWEFIVNQGLNFDNLDSFQDFLKNTKRARIIECLEKYLVEKKYL